MLEIRVSGGWWWKTAKANQEIWKEQRSEKFYAEGDPERIHRTTAKKGEGAGARWAQHIDGVIERFVLSYLNCSRRGDGLRFPNPESSRPAGANSTTIEECKITRFEQ